MGAPTKKAPPRKRAPRQRPAGAVTSAPVIDKPPGFEDLPDDAGQMTEEQWDRLQSAVDNLSGDGSPIGPDGEIRPVEVGRKGKTGPEMTHIFTVDGRKYYVPKRPTPALMLQFLTDLQDPRVGRDGAVMTAFTSMVGKAGMRALAESPDTDEEDIAAVMSIVAHLMFGAIRKWAKAADPS